MQEEVGKVTRTETGTRLAPQAQGSPALHVALGSIPNTVKTLHGGHAYRSSTHRWGRQGELRTTFCDAVSLSPTLG